MSDARYSIQSFVIKVWLEYKERGSERMRWHGRVTHVPSGEQHYIKDLNEIAPIIARYTHDPGGRISFGWRVRYWIQKFRRSEDKNSAQR